MIYKTLHRKRNNKTGKVNSSCFH